MQEIKGALLGDSWTPQRSKTAAMKVVRVLVPKVELDSALVSDCPVLT
jgi:hypothetical protein